MILTIALILPANSVFAAVKPVNEPIEFADVLDSHWAYYDIRTMYECGLMLGTGGDNFSPSGKVSIAQGIAVTMRVWDMYNGGDGIIQQKGEKWYDGAVAMAIDKSIIRDGQFDNYERAATRAELAGLLASALPDNEYKAINNIEEIPDVNQSTLNSDDIFKLYNAGILAGSDGYGTFYPDRDITRAEISAILNRMVNSWNRKEFTLLPKPADLTVYSSSKSLLVNGFPIYGLTRINGEYYVPVALLSSDRTSVAANFVTCHNSGGNNYYISYKSSYGEIPMLTYASAPPEGKVLGMADPNPGSLKVYYDKNVQGAVYTIGGAYPMLNLEVLGVVEENGNFVWNTDQKQNHTTAYESDLVGANLANLVGTSDRKTAIAIHDYLVNKLTYDINVSAPSGTTQAEYEKAYELTEKAYEEYSLSINRPLSSGYGICQDYAELFQAMCIRLGIPCEIVVGNAGGPHAWNKVYVDGKWLYMDCTWDDPVSRKPVLRYDYCLVGADVMVKSHYWDGDDYPMPDKYDPAWEKLDPNNITSADMFRKCLIAQMVIANRQNPDGEKTIRLCVTKSGAYGGTGCIYAGYEGAWWWQMQGGYDSKSNMYVYKFY